MQRRKYKPITMEEISKLTSKSAYYMIKTEEMVFNLKLSRHKGIPRDKFKYLSLAAIENILKEKIEKQNKLLNQ